MAYMTKVSKQGNSLGVRIPSDFLRMLNLSSGDSVAMVLRDQHIEITRADDDYNAAMRLGKECSARYRVAFAKLAK